ncbi:MAG TPA: rhodanese-like domain-containing protein [Noviherbaspirillum sp.]|uniref:rhodanese-like domain-containing protein n=1 Tax=Noviherbaspirillum sp. TaxID=1926288 RepID=UPI002F92CC4D
MKFLIDNVWLIAIALISGGALLWPGLQRRGKTVSTLQATQLINQGRALILDVRDPAAFNAGHLRDAKNIPIKELSNRIGELDKFKAKTAIVVCQSGAQAGKVASRLKAAGFSEAVSLEGGIAAWQSQGLPLTR